MIAEATCQTCRPDRSEPSSFATLPSANNWQEEDGHEYVAIDHLESFEPFFLSMVSPGNQWLFCSSHGSLSAGRESSGNALFPYDTVDKIMDNWNSTGPWTALVAGDRMWNPFRPSVALMTPVHRRLMKSPAGDELVFDESHGELGLRMTYRWQFSNRYGFVRRACLRNESDRAVSLRLVDGLDNFLPAGVDERLQQQLSCLTHAYKISELDCDGRLLIHRLAAGITDEPAPLECLRATTIWSDGLEGATTLLTRRDAERFLRGEATAFSPVARGKRGAYFLAEELSLAPGESREWMLVAEVNQTQREVAALRARLLDDPSALVAGVHRDIAEGRERLAARVASADGFQRTADRDTALYHYQNTLCNIMRGGVPDEGQIVRKKPFLAYLDIHNRRLSERHSSLLASLPDAPSRQELLATIATAGDPDLTRLAVEYLPLVMSRRHGDPSRPWNKFFIRPLDGEGDGRYHFEGNWRDIFQNWEALALSHPDFLPGFIAKFLNASTIDGHNPYRITSEGIDWEVPDPEDPWASIGYWGDHQIIYLLKLLELESRIHPDAFADKLDRPDHVFADVPYRIKSWEAILADPRQSIAFDWERHHALMARKELTGSDGLLRQTSSGEPVRATLLEKLLLPALVKLANLVPGGGLWMNTQRPEWNDANNALAGGGLSVVTTAYLYRYLGFLAGICGSQSAEAFHLSPALARLMEELGVLFESPAWSEPGKLDCRERFHHVQSAQLAAQHYRKSVYGDLTETQSLLQADQIRHFLQLAREVLRRTLEINRRPDGLWHAYNILEMDRANKTFGVRHLPLMLEGQVAILTSGLLDPEESAGLLDALRQSALRSERHPTYLLYPDAATPGFLTSNRVPVERAQAIPALAALLARGDDSLLVKDESCGYRFHPDLVNEYALGERLERLGIHEDRQAIEDLYEEVFQHRLFTGRSGTMFSYEGLGCVYWHMVSKLMLASQEAALDAAPGDRALFGQLAESYYHIQSGLGFRQSPERYGAFPSEPYSHSPSHAGAQQPGLTGQVKEGMLARFGELGITFDKGCLSFHPRLLREAEFAGLPAGPDREALPAGRLEFTIAGTPVVYHRAPDAHSIEATVHFTDGASETFPDGILNETVTRGITSRDERVSRIDVRVPAATLLP